MLDSIVVFWVLNFFKKMVKGRGIVSTHKKYKSKFIGDERDKDCDLETTITYIDMMKNNERIA